MKTAKYDVVKEIKNKGISRNSQEKRNVVQFQA